MGTATSGNYTVDTLLPTATVTIDKAALKAGETAVVSIDFGQEVSGFALTDLTSPAGALSNLQVDAQDPTKYTATFTPTVDLEDAVNVISLDLTGVTDTSSTAAGVGTATSGNYTVDTLLPTAALSLDRALFPQGGEGLLTVQFSEPVQGLEAAHFTLESGVLSEPVSADGGRTWTTRLSPRSPAQGQDYSFSLNLAGVQDLAGNAGQGSTSSAAYRYDYQPPSVLIEADRSQLRPGESTPVRFRFTEAVSGFSPDQLFLSHVSLSDWQQDPADPSLYRATLTYTPQPGGDGGLTLELPASHGPLDAAGNRAVGGLLRLGAAGAGVAPYQSVLVPLFDGPTDPTPTLVPVLVRDGTLREPISWQPLDLAVVADPPLQGAGPLVRVAITPSTPLQANDPLSGAASLALPLELLLPAAATTTTGDGAPAAGAPSGAGIGVFSLDGQGHPQPYLLNDRLGTGASLVDLDGDGAAETVWLQLREDDRADRLPGQAGVGVDVFAAHGPLVPALVIDSEGRIQLVSGAEAMTPVAFNLRVSLRQRGSSADQIGYVVLEAQDPAGHDPRQWPLATLRERARRLQETLQPNSAFVLNDADLVRDLQLISGQSVRFFAVTKGVFTDLLDPLLAQGLQDPQALAGRLKWLDGIPTADGSGITLQTDSGNRLELQPRLAPLDLQAVIASQQSHQPLLDLRFTPLVDQAVLATLFVAREAMYTNVLGFYRVLDREGRVRDPDSGALLSPGDPRYNAVALAASNRVTELQQIRVPGRAGTLPPRSVILQEDGLLAPFVEVQGLTYFAYARANPDRLTHIRVLGQNLFGVEDLLGGGDLDFNDIIFGLRAALVAPGTDPASLPAPFQAPAAADPSATGTISASPFGKPTDAAISTSATVGTSASSLPEAGLGQRRFLRSAWAAGLGQRRSQPSPWAAGLAWARERWRQPVGSELDQPVAPGTLSLASPKPQVSQPASPNGRPQPHGADSEAALARVLQACRQGQGLLDRPCLEDFLALGLQGVTAQNLDGVMTLLARAVSLGARADDRTSLQQLLAVVLEQEPAGSTCTADGAEHGDDAPSAARPVPQEPAQPAWRQLLRRLRQGLGLGA